MSLSLDTPGLSRLPVVLLLAISVGACGMLVEKEPKYIKSEEASGLKVPEDLNPPNLSGALVIPEDDDEEFIEPVPDVPPTAMVQYQDGIVLQTDASVLQVDEGTAILIINDVPESVWRRAGESIERLANLQTISGDEARQSYIIEYDDAQSRESRPGWFSRVVMRKDAPIDLSGQYQMQLVPQRIGKTRIRLMVNGSVIDVESAIEILSLLQAELG